MAKTYLTNNQQMTATNKYKPKPDTLKLSQSMTGKFIQLTADGDTLTARYMGSASQLGHMIEVTAKEHPIFAEAVKLAATKLNTDKDEEVEFRAMVPDIKKVFKESLNPVTVKAAMKVFVDRTGVETNESKFKAAMAAAGFKLHSRNDGGNVTRCYMVETV